MKAEHKAELIYCLVVLAVLSLLIYGGSKMHPRSNFNYEQSR
jgi:hypothetical protein